MFPRVLCAAFVIALSSLAPAAPLTGAFTYQGQLLEGGVPVDGSYEVRFRLFDDPAGGAQIGGEVGLVLAVNDGLFTASLDFGAAAFNGERRWLEIAVRPQGSVEPVTVLSPRRELTASPNANFAIASGTATNTSSLNGQPASFYTNAANLSSGTIPGARLSGTYAQALSLSNPANQIAGAGGGLTGLNASNLATGEVSDARLSANVALRNAANFFSGQNTFSNNNSFLANNTFGGNNTFNANTAFNGFVGIGTPPGTPLDLASTNLVGARFALNPPGAGTAVYATNAATTGVSFGVRGVQRSGANFSTPPGGAGVFGESNSGVGVAGFTAGTEGVPGVQGTAVASSGFAYGGYFTSISPDGTGAFVRNFAASGASVALRARSDSPSGFAAYFEMGRNYFEGNTGIGTSTPAAKLHVNGTTILTGPLDVSGTATFASGVAVNATLRTRSLHASAWVPTSSVFTYGLISGGHAAFGTTAGQLISFFAPLDLPQGATITSVVVYVTDNDAGAISVRPCFTTHTTHGSFSGLAASQDSVGASTSVQAVTFGGLSHVVDNTARSLFVLANWTVPATSTNLRVGNIVVTYSITSPLP